MIVWSLFLGIFDFLSAVWGDPTKPPLPDDGDNRGSLDPNG